MPEFVASISTALLLMYLQNMDQWSVRMAWLELQLMFKLAKPSEIEQLLNNTAHCAIQVFVQHTMQHKPTW